MMFLVIIAMFAVLHFSFLHNFVIPMFTPTNELLHNVEHTDEIDDLKLPT